MSKKFALFLLFILIPTAQAIQIQQIDNYSIDKKVRSFNPTQKGDFQLQINSPYSIYLFNKTQKIREIHRSGHAGWTIDTTLLNNSRYWASGFRFPGEYLIYNKSHILVEKEYPSALDWAEFVGSNVFLSRSQKGSELRTFGGETHWFREFEQGREIITETQARQNTSFAIVSAKNGKLYVSDKSGILTDISANTNSRLRGKFLDSNKILVFWPEGISIHKEESGNQLWKINDRVDSTTVVFDDTFVYSSEGKLVYRNTNGEKITTEETGFKEPYLFKLPERKWIAAWNYGEKISFYGLNGEKKGSVTVDGLSRRPEVAQYDSGKMELAVIRGEEVQILDLEREVNKENYSINNTVLVGDGKEMLKAIAGNATVMIGDEYSEINDSFETEKKVLGIGPVSGVQSISDFDRLTGNQRRKYYVGSREKAVYVAALAARNNASLTFDESEADRDFSNYSIKELQDIFIQKFDPHHVVVADLDSRKGLLAGYMAVKQGSLPLDNDGYNGVILQNRIDKMFERIGENRNTVFQGKHVSLLEAPPIKKQDPVEKGLITDPKDGKSYRTDLPYGNLDQDVLLEAGVGRYPESVSSSSIIFHRSLNRKVGGNATVASEYLASSWPAILATGGGGLRYGTRLESTFKNQGYKTTHLVEYRSEPVAFLVSLAPVEITGFMGQLNTAGDILKKTVSAGAATAFENSLIAIRALSYTEQLMEMYYEFKWNTFDFELQRGLDKLDELRVRAMSEKGLVQKSVMKLLYAFIWPERHPEINTSSIRAGMKNSDVFYYQGIGNSSGWRLPKKESTSRSSYYTAGNGFEPEDIPEMERTIIWDNSNLAGKKNAEMRKQFLKKGASAYLGYSTVNYAAYSSITGYNFFKRRKSLGNSLRKAVNTLRTTGFIYSPKSAYLNGLQQKMSNSLRLYGNPEMPKDPIQKDSFRIERNCESTTCHLEITAELPQEIRKHQGQKFLASNASNFILQPGRPITPLYSTGYRIGNASIISTDVEMETKKVKDLQTETYRPLSHDGRFHNITSKGTEKGPVWDIKNKGGDIQLSVVGFRQSGNSTDIVEKITSSIRYRTPASLEFETQNNSLIAKVESEKGFKGNLVYKVDNNARSKAVDIRKGRNIYNLTLLENGVYEVEGYLLKDRVISHEIEKLTIKQRPEIIVFTPEIPAGSTRKITAVVSNPNNFSLKEKVNLDTGSKVVAGMLEEERKSVNLEPGETEKVKFRIIGLARGNSSVTVEASNASITVKSSTDGKKLLSPTSLRRKLDSPTSAIKLERSSDRLEAHWRSNYGSLKMVRKPESSRYTLETPAFRSAKIVSPDGIVKETETETGIYRVRTDKVIRKSNLSEQKFREKISILEKEVEKLERFINLQGR